MSEAFEEIVAVLLEADGYWVKRNVKFRMPASSDLRLEPLSIELDVVALRPTDPSEVLIVECKAYARSGGVDWTTFGLPRNGSARQHRYKLFWDVVRRDRIVTYLKNATITPDIPHIFCLASAATAAGSHTPILNYLTENGMRFFDQRWVKDRLERLGANDVYQNCVVSTLASIYHHPDRAKFL